MITLSYIEIAYLSAMLIIVSFLLGFTTAIFFSSKGTNKTEVLVKSFAIGWSLIWVSLTAWTIFTQGQTVSLLYDASGLITIGFVFGKKAGDKTIDQVADVAKKVKEIADLRK